MNLYDEINEMLEKKEFVNIAVSGMTCSGKSTLANDIKDKFSKICSVSIIKQDDYFKDREDFERGKHGFLEIDSPNAFNVDEFREDVKELLSTFKTITPRYHVESNKRIAKDVKVSAGKINIFEGLHTIGILNDEKDMLKIFLETDISICLERRIKRDSKLFNVQAEKIKEYFDICILPIYYKYILSQKRLADLVIRNNIIWFGGQNNESKKDL